MKYFVIDRQGYLYPHRYINDMYSPRSENLPFNRGKRGRRTENAQPLEFTLFPLDTGQDDDDESGEDMPELFDDFSFPLFKNDLILALNEFGVDNVEYYNAIINDPDNRERYTNYKVANIIGECETFAELEKQLLDMVRFDVYILVSERLKDFLITKGFTKVDFMGLNSVALGVADS
jgi:hypothetical protein